MRSVNTSPYILKIKTASGKNRIHWGQCSYIFTLQKNLEDCTVPEGVEPCSSSEWEQTKLFLIKHIILVSGSGTWIYSSCYSRRYKLSRSCTNYTEILGLQVRRQIELWVGGQRETRACELPTLGWQEAQRLVMLARWMDTERHRRNSLIRKEMKLGDTRKVDEDREGSQSWRPLEEKRDFSTLGLWRHKAIAEGPCSEAPAPAASGQNGFMDMWSSAVGNPGWNWWGNSVWLCEGLCWASSRACWVTGATCHEGLWSQLCRCGLGNAAGKFHQWGEWGRTTVPVAVAKDTCHSFNTNSTVVPIRSKIFFTSW